MQNTATKTAVPSVGQVRKPVNIAHRGVTDRFPGNSLKALSKAIQAGIDAVEFDVRETLDGNFVLAHDPKINDVIIKDTKLRTLEQVSQQAGQMIVTLHDALAQCRGRLTVFVDLKDINSIEKLTVRVKDSKFAAEKINLISFDTDILQRISQHNRHLRLGMIFDEYPQDLNGLKAHANLSSLVLNQKNADHDLVTKCRELNLGVYLWNIPNLESAVSALALQADGLITDCPVALKSYLEGKSLLRPELNPAGTRGR